MPARRTDAAKVAGSTRFSLLLDRECDRNRAHCIALADTPLAGQGVHVDPCRCDGLDRPLGGRLLAIVDDRHLRLRSDASQAVDELLGS